MQRRSRWLAMVLACVAFATPCVSHEIRPAIVTVAVTATADVTIVTNLEALIAGIGPQHKDSRDAPEAQTYTSLRSLPPDALRDRFNSIADQWLTAMALDVDGTRVGLAVDAVSIPPVGDTALARLSTVRLTAPAPANAQRIRWRYGADYGSNIFRLKLADGRMAEGGWLKDGRWSEALAIETGLGRSAMQRAVDYVVLGFTHIVPKGLDHILFVLGIYLLGANWRSLLAIVTTFTLAHSLTLALGLFGLVDVSPRIVEPLIALSIVYVAVENLLTKHVTSWRYAVVFGFGLLHGLGFAGILRDADLPATDTLLALVGFNIGVELGQLSVIVAAFALTGFWFRDKPWYRSRLVQPACFLLALIGAGWTIERIWFA